MKATNSTQHHLDVKGSIVLKATLENMRMAIYGRFSSDLQRKASIEDQVRQCRGLAEKEHWTIVKDFICSDEGISGATLNEREGLQAIIAAAKSKPRPFDGVLIDDTSRLGRNLGLVLKVTEIFKHHDVFVYFVSQRLDSRDPNFRQLLIMYGMVDEQYLVGLREKVWRGQEGIVLNRMNPGGSCFGYHNIPVEDPARKGEYGRAAIIGVRQEIDL